MCARAHVLVSRRAIAGAHIRARDEQEKEVGGEGDDQLLLPFAAHLDEPVERLRVGSQLEEAEQPQEPQRTEEPEVDAEAERGEVEQQDRSRSIASMNLLACLSRPTIGRRYASSSTTDQTRARYSTVKMATEMTSRMWNSAA
ncbi:MAG: hypothetical protein ACNA8R_06385 [Nitriliruptoraceae bacterium]